MDWITIKNKTESWIKKYRYVVLIVMIGLVLMSLPEKKAETVTNESTEDTIHLHNAQEEEKRLEQILGRIKGVGEVEVMLTLLSSQQTIYQTDIDSSDSGNNERSNTVIITDSERANSGLISRIDAPQYMGAVIVCKGGNDPVVRLAVVDAVSKALGLSSNEISVLKMK